MSIDRRTFLIGGAALTLTLPSAAALAKAPRPLAQVVGVQRFDVGEAVVTALSDGYIELSADAFPAATAEEVEALLREAFLDPGGKLRGAVNAFLVQTPGATVLVDTGGGAAFGPTLGRLPEQLAAAGVAPADIGVVALTHLHPDHIGGLLTGGESGTPVFANARMLVHGAEIDFWTDEAAMNAAPEGVRPFFLLARQALDAYGERVVRIDKDGEVPGGLEAMALPGHTPGHTGYVVSSGGDALLVWGDIVHAPPLQFPRPDWSIAFDVDPDQSRATRKRAFEMAAADRLEVAGMHHFFPGLGHVARAGEGYDFVPSRWEHVIGEDG